MRIHQLLQVPALVLLLLGPCLWYFPGFILASLELNPRVSKIKQLKPVFISMLRVEQKENPVVTEEPPCLEQDFEKAKCYKVLKSSDGKSPPPAGMTGFLPHSHCDDSPQVWLGLRNRIPPPESHEEERDKDSLNHERICDGRARPVPHSRRSGGASTTAGGQRAPGGRRACLESGEPGRGRGVLPPLLRWEARTVWV